MLWKTISRLRDTREDAERVVKGVDKISDSQCA